MSPRGRLVCKNWNLPTWHADEAFNLSWHNWHTCSTFSVVLANTHDGSLPVCPTSTQPRECKIAKNTYKNNENLSERTPWLERNQHTFNMNKKHYNRRWFWSTLPNALRAVDLGGLPGELWRTCVSKLDGGAKNIFWPSNLTLFGLISFVFPPPHPTCPAFWQAYFS